MPRDREKVRRLLQEAALELYRAHGFDATTTAQIAERAGVTERTFFRHFPDKREVLFDGEAQLAEILTVAVRDAPPTLGPWPAMIRALEAAEPLLVVNREPAERRREVVAASASLQERESAKVQALTTALATALRERGVAESSASLTARMGMVVFAEGWTRWMKGSAATFGNGLAAAAGEARELVS